MARPSWDTQYDIAPDGRFLLLKPLPRRLAMRSSSSKLVEELKRLVASISAITQSPHRPGSSADANNIAALRPLVPAASPLYWIVS